MRILGIDPGTTRSAWVTLDTVTRLPVTFGLAANEPFLDYLREMGGFLGSPHQVVIEKAEGSYGRIVIGGELLETVFWSGRFAEAASAWASSVDRIGRKAVVAHVCGVATASDAHVRAALIDLYGGKELAIGRKSAPGPLHGMNVDERSALALALTWADRR